MLAYSAIAFSLPFILGHQQMLVGAIVNCALVLAAFNLRGKRLLPVIVLPSIGAYLAGLLFGAESSALLHLIPFIWIGNAALVYSIKWLALERKSNRIASLGAASAAKSAFLFASAFALFQFGLVPQAFLSAFGAMQLATALVGGAAALGIQRMRAAMVHAA